MSQKGIIYLPVLLVAIVGVLAFLVISSNAPLRDQLLNSLYPKSKSHAAAPWDGVASINIDYNQDVETYWANHPFNPSSPNYRPDINSPSNQVNVATQFGGNTQAALDSLPSSGGTLYFPAGDYSNFTLVGKNNVHFIGNPGATIAGTSRIAGCDTALNYHDFSLAVTNRDPDALSCATTNRLKNIYFKNITFDGGGSALDAFDLHAVQDMVIDNATFQNFADYTLDPSLHIGQISGASMLDNIWVRNSSFLGKTAFSIYVDGMHGGGMINNTFSNNHRRGYLLFLTNDDFTKDYNGNGSFEDWEVRSAKYNVVYGNTFDGGLKNYDGSPVTSYEIAAFTGANNLVMGNIITNRVTNIGAFDAKTALVNDTYTYSYYGNKIIANDARGGVSYLMEINGGTCPSGQNNFAHVGKYEIKNNRAASGQTIVENPTGCSSIEGPNVVNGNCFGTNCPAPSSDPTPSSNPTQTPIPTPTPSPTPAGSPTPVPSNNANANFPIGVFEDGNMVWGEIPTFTDMVNDLQSKGMNAVIFGNNNASRDEPILNVSDQKNFNVYFGAHSETDSYFSDPTPTLQEARNIIYPVVDLIKNHTSVKGYNVADEPSLGDLDRVKFLTQAYMERDTSKPAGPVLIAVGTGNVIYDAVLPTMFIMDAYPFSVQSAACDFTMKGFGYTNKNLSQYIREMTATKASNVPLYIILQTHKVGDSSWGINQLRVPSVPEVRGQHWISIGEGAHGIFWFIYFTQQDWTGLKDNPTLMNEISSLAQRTNPLTQTLLNAKRNSTDLFTANNGAYISTLTSNDGTKKYAVVANIGNCSSSQNITINSTQQGSLKNLETGQILPLGSQISFLPGDGKVFELVSSQTTPAPTPKPGDLNGDGRVGVIDFSILLSKWNTSDPAADLNQDGKVNILDFSILLSNWN